METKITTMDAMEFFKKLNNAILNDTELKELFKQKQDLLNVIITKYKISRTDNILTLIIDLSEAEMMDKIDYMIEFRTNQIKNHYNLK